MSKNVEKGTRQYQVNEALRKNIEELAPLCKKIGERLVEDNKSKIDTSTLLFFGFLLFIAVFCVSLFFLGKNSQLNLEENELDQGLGRGINPPPVVPPANTAEAEAYMERQEKARNPEIHSQETPTQPQPTFPPATDHMNIRYEYVDSLNRPINPADLSKYQVVDTF